MRQRLTFVQAIALFILMIVGVTGMAGVGYGALIVLHFATIDPKLGAFVGAVLAMTAILWIIRRINRRDDPRNAKRPPNSH